MDFKNKYKNFQYRKYKENSADDEPTKSAIVGNAILAESLQAYRFEENLKS
jgi:hypothetical protein